MTRARDEQLPPDGDWLTWLFLGGRGAGKTRAGAEWLRAQVETGATRVALIGPAFADVREVMLSGPSGLLNIGPPDARPTYEASRRRLVWPGGAIGYAFSSEDPDGLRGPQFEAAWADPDIDFIGIDWYAPLSDWRDGEAHLDALAGAASIYDPDYLAANVEGGEGHDWFYASAADRDAQVRTPITDGAYGEPWVWRYKDLRAWWSNPHHDRPGGVRNASSTAWVPQSKPIRLVELGCPAVDKGANQPNVFIDPKSSESLAPYYSSGERDDLIQRRYIEALLGYWSEAGRNPGSNLDGQPMLDLPYCHVWTWDARPFPEFPARTDVWADGDNWRRGHWLTGRAGQSALADIVGDLARRAGLDGLDASSLRGVLAGFRINQSVTARAVLEQLGAAFGFAIADRAAGPSVLPVQTDAAPLALSRDQLADPGEGAERLAFTRAAPDELPAEARLIFSADDGDYRSGAVSARGLDHVREGAVEIRLPALADRSLAQGWARAVLSRARAEGESARLLAPPSLVALEPGDAVTLDAGPAGRTWRVATLDGLAARSAELTGAPAGPSLIAGPEPGAANTAPPPSRPLLRLLDLPLSPDEGEARDGLWAAAWSDPWPGEMVVFAGADLQSATERARINAPAFCAVLTAGLAPGFEGRWDTASAVELRLSSGAVSSADAAAVLSGANRLAVETASGWEVLAFRGAVLTGPDTWRLSGLLRGLGGSPTTGAASGARAVVLDGAGAVLPVSLEERGAPLVVAAVPPGRALTDPSVRVIEALYEGVDRRPLRPVHLRTRWSGDALSLSWIRRGRINGDAWTSGEVALGEERELYRVRLIDETGALAMEVETEQALHEVSASALASLALGDLALARFTVAQIGASYGPGVETGAVLSPAVYG